jgi:hypothetical protein
VLSYLDGKILAWPSALNPEECERIRDRFAWADHGVKHEPALAAELGALLHSRMHGAPALEWRPHLTVSCKPVPWHLDAPLGATHKLCLYLDPAGVGTVFRAALPPGAQGTIVLFDIGLEHKAGEYSGERHVLGLRALLRETPATE